MKQAQIKGFIIFILVMLLMAGIIFNAAKGFYPSKNNETNSTTGTTTTTIISCAICPECPKDTNNYEGLKATLDIERKKNTNLSEELAKLGIKIARLRNQSLKALELANLTHYYLNDTDKHWNKTNRPIINRINSTNDRLIRELEELAQREI